MVIAVVSGIVQYAGVLLHMKHEIMSQNVLKRGHCNGWRSTKSLFCFLEAVTTAADSV